jgi:hypothetical protein
MNRNYHSQLQINHAKEWSRIEKEWRGIEERMASSGIGAPGKNGGEGQRMV